MVLPKQVTQVQVQLPNLDTTHNCVPLPWYRGYKWVFQPTIFGQQNQIHIYNFQKSFLQNCRVVIYSEMTQPNMVLPVMHTSFFCLSLTPIPSHIQKQSKL